MDKTKKILIDNQKSFPELHDQIRYIEDIEDDNLESERKIGRLKCFLEGVFKSILIKIDQEYKQNDKLYSSTPIEKLFEKTYIQLERLNNSLGREVLFFSGFKSLIESIKLLRNEVCPDGHGRVPNRKGNISVDEKLCSLFIDMSDSLISYLLGKYFETEFGSLIYQDNSTFNSYLDDENTTNVKNVLYSKLLFENDPDSYEAEFDSWNEDQAERAVDYFAELNDPRY